MMSLGVVMMKWTSLCNRRFKQTLKCEYCSLFNEKPLECKLQSNPLIFNYNYESSTPGNENYVSRLGQSKINIEKFIFCIESW